MFKRFFVLLLCSFLLASCNVNNTNKADISAKENNTQHTEQISEVKQQRLQDMFLLSSGRKTVYVQDAMLTAPVYLRFSIYGKTIPINKESIVESDQLVVEPAFTDLKTTESEKKININTPELSQSLKRDLVVKHFHIIHGAFSAFERMRFAIASRAENTDLSLNTIRRPQGWSVERVNVVLSENDWLSAMWIQQDKEVPAKWLAKRYTFSIPNRKRRGSSEYREVYPECMPEFDATTEVLNSLSLSMRNDKAQQCLNEFSSRADAFFTIATNDKNNLDITLIKEVNSNIDINNIEIFKPTQNIQTIPFNLARILGAVEFIEKDDRL